MKNLSQLVRPRTHLRVYLVVLGAACAVAAAGSVFIAYGFHRQATALQSRNAVVAKQRKAPVPKLKRSDIEERRRWEALAEDRAFPWQIVFRSVERAIDPDIELLEFHPDAKQRTVILRGHARNVGAITRYLKMLADDPVFERTYLVRTVVEKRGALDVVSFEISARLSRI